MSVSVSGAPLAIDGIVDHLTDEQTAKLMAFWKVFFQVVDDAPIPGSDLSGSADANNEAASTDFSQAETQEVEPELREAKAYMKKYGSQRFTEAFWKFVGQDYADTIMLKFLRARKWEPNAAMAMLATCIAWRIDARVEDIVARGEEGMRDAEGFIKQLEIGKAYMQGTDRAGRPIYYVHVRLHRLFDQSAKALEDFVIFQMDCLRRLFTYSVDKCTLVFDMTGFGLANMDWKCVYFIQKCLEAYFPESLNILLIHNAPWIFQGVWRVLTPMLDPVVRAKIQFTKSTADLAVHIDERHLVKQLGGTNEWEWEYTSVVPGENDRMKDEETKRTLEVQRAELIASYERLTRSWITTTSNSTSPSDLPSTSNTSLPATTSEANLGPIAPARRTLADELRVHAFKLDPYVRGRSVYDRVGNVVGDGRVVWMYPGLADADAREECGCVAGREREQEHATEDGANGSEIDRDMGEHV